MKAILFICHYNSIRSPMASAILQHMHPKKYYVQSAGVQTKDIDGYVLALLKEKQIDVSHHISKKISDIHDDHFDLIIALTPIAFDAAKKWASIHATDVILWDIKEPHYFDKREDTLQSFEQVYQQLYAAIQKEFP